MRRRSAPKRQILPDPKFKSEQLAKFINHVMVSGKKSLAERIVYGALDIAGNKLKTVKKPVEKTDDNGDEGAAASSSSPLTAIDLLNEVLNKVKPGVEVKSRRVGGATYQVPVEVSAKRSMALAMRWVVDSAKKRSEKSMKNRLAAEMFDAYNDRGNAVKKREETHRMAKANQAFAHFRW
jgi:small subunit ribosomal protein S7